MPPKPILGALANIEGAIREAFKVAGEINTEFTAEIRPDVLAWDLTMPGYSVFRGRRFSFATTANLGVVAAGTVAFQALNTEGVIIERIGQIASGTGGIITNIRYVSSDVALPYALAQRAAWVDQGEINTDGAPVATVNGIQADSVLGAPIGTYITLANSPAPEWTYPIHLPQNAFILLRWSGLCANTGFYFSGRIA